MKKITLILTLLCLMAAGVSAQDIIVKKNGEEIKAKIVELTESAIRYRNFSNPEGPVYNIARGEVFMIKYENGEKEVISAETTPATPAAAAASSAYSALPVRSNVKAEPDKPIIGARASGYYGYILNAVKGADMMVESGTGYGLGVYAEFPVRSTYLGVAMNYFSIEYKFNDKDLPAQMTETKLQAGQLSFDFYVAARAKHFYLNTGLRTSLLLSAKSKYQSQTTDVKDGCNPFQLGVLIGLGGSFGRFDLGLDTSLMFTNFYKVDGADAAFMSGLVGLHLGYKF